MAIMKQMHGAWALIPVSPTSTLILALAETNL